MNNSVSTVTGKIKIKIVFLGNQSVGKSSIIDKYVNDKFEETAHVYFSIAVADCRDRLLSQKHTIQDQKLPSSAVGHSWSVTHQVPDSRLSEGRTLQSHNFRRQQSFFSEQCLSLAPTLQLKQNRIRLYLAYREQNRFGGYP